MDFDDTPVEKAFRAEAREWLDAHGVPKGHPDDFSNGHQDESTPDSVHTANCQRWQRTLWDGGWAGIAWPKAFGGRGGRPIEASIFGQEQARYGVSTGVFAIAHGMVGPTLMRHGTPEQQSRFLPAMLRGDEAEIALRENVPDLLILDWMLPGVSGIELCRRLRQWPETERLPVIMLTARGEESERVRGLSVGADDYVVKPFSTPELLARVKAMLRRANPSLLSHVLKVGDLVLDRQQHRVYRKEKEVRLGPTEFRLLEYFMMSPGRVFSRSQLLDGVWGPDIYVDDRTVDVHVGRLRKAINLGRALDPIRTVRGAGYSFG